MLMMVLDISIVRRCVIELPRYHLIVRQLLCFQSSDKRLKEQWGGCREAPAQTYVLVQHGRVRPTMTVDSNRVSKLLYSVSPSSNLIIT